MRKLIMTISVSLDGFMADANGGIDEFAPSEEVHRYFNEFIDQSDALLLGRQMYELVASYWDRVDPEDASIPEVEAEFARIFQATPRYVFSRTLDSVDERATLIKDDVAGEVFRLKEQPGGYLALGCGPELLATFVEHGLIDEFRLFVNPFVYGRGKALFGAIPQTLPLRLLESRVFESGAVFHRYIPT